eukprot:COSAG01_NODE_3454_length_6075_cov_5.552878_4_plen_180_part_00
MSTLLARYYRGESHYWVMTPTIDSLVKTGVMTALQPSREAVLGASVPQLGALLRSSTAHFASERGSAESRGDIFDCEVFLAQIGVLMVQCPEVAREVRRRKILWKARVDENKAQPGVYCTSDRALKGELSPAAQFKALRRLTDALFKLALDLFPREQWPEPPAGARLFETHGRKGKRAF